jgi:hypothetical protein
LPLAIPVFAAGGQEQRRLLCLIDSHQLLFEVDNLILGQQQKAYTNIGEAPKDVEGTMCSHQRRESWVSLAKVLDLILLKISL